MNLFIIPTNTCFGLACPINDIESYNKIYELKSRKSEKPLSIMVNDFKYLEENTTLNKNQITFLKKYKNPFTILCSVKNNIINEKIKNKHIYKKIAFRIAHNFIQKKLILDNGPLFLTSANKSGNNELISTKQILEIFSRSDQTNIYAHKEFKIKGDKHYSDIFEFIGESCNIKYIRQ